MNIRTDFNSIRLGCLVLAGIPFLTTAAQAQHYLRTDLVSNQTGAAPKTDSNLVNGWGLSRSSTSPWWISDNGTGMSTLIDGNGNPLSLVVTVPGSPTGTVYNGSPDFQIVAGRPAVFLFATEEGAIYGWNPSVNSAAAMKVASSNGAIYKGLAIAMNGGKRYLYAADFHNGRIDVFDSSFNKVDNGFSGDADEVFRFEGHLRGLAPFNIVNIGGNLFVAFAKQDDAKKDDAPGAGSGLIAAFTTEGRLLQMFEHTNDLNSPWGMALAPGDFGTFSHHLIVGQFGSGEILAYDIVTGRLTGKLRDASDAPIAIPGLWGIGFGNGANAGPANNLFFAAGPDDEANGLFGVLKPVATDLTQGNGN